MISSRDEDSLLVDLVKSYPHIYDKRSKDFKDIFKKNNSWKEIGEVLQMSDCQTRWARLRERYSREKKIRELETRSGSGSTTRQPFPLYEQMNFLFKFVKSRKSITNISNLTSKKSLHPIQTNESTSEKSETLTKNKAISPAARSPPNRKILSQLDRKSVLPALSLDPSSSMLSDAPNRFTKKIKRTSSPDKIEQSFLKLSSISLSDTSDEDDIFAKAVACQLRKMSEPQKSQLKGQIMKILYNL
ncbi:uncharacterized protein [Temnothorax nylanderi]|uniref:uncharacterized protein n=1 Tax=Temnothorax nylanderi TaxID=102681 RepID=UPI003A83D219